MLRGGIWMWMKSNYFGSLKAKLILAPLGIQKWVRPSMDQYRMFFMQTSTRPPSMNRKPIKHGRCCIQINQLPTDTHVELEDKSSILTDSCLLVKFHLFIIFLPTSNLVNVYQCNFLSTHSTAVILIRLLISLHSALVLENPWHKNVKIKYQEYLSALA